MESSKQTHLNYLRKVFYFNHLFGLTAGGLFPVFASLFVGTTVLRPLFFAACAAVGLGLGSVQFFFVRQTLKRQLQQQLELLTTLSGIKKDAAQATLEDLNHVLESSVRQVDQLVKDLIGTVDPLFPRFKTLAEAGRYLFERAHDGLKAAEKTRLDVASMVEKQREIGEKTEAVAHRTQDETALSRQLSASLEEMAGALETSTEKFLETTTAVDEMASSVKEVALQASQIAQGVESASRDLDVIGEAFGKIGEGAAATAQATGKVRQDAENGLSVVERSITEMDRVEQEGSRARDAMERLSSRTGEVTKIIEVIRELVSDTELLAFNAAIIAAQAGEEGRGFSVVAEEIRDLADRTANSAGDIHQIVEAIGDDTREVSAAVETTGMRIASGKQMILSTGEALRQIVESSRSTAADSEEISSLTRREEKRAQALLSAAGDNLRAVQSIAKAIQEQKTAIDRIQEGVTQMKSASDQVSGAMEEQVRANREFDKGLIDREQQIQAIEEAIRFQQETSEQIFSHFASSRDRLEKNAEKVATVNRELADMETMAKKLRERIIVFGLTEEESEES